MSSLVIYSLGEDDLGHCAGPQPISVSAVTPIASLG